MADRWVFRAPRVAAWYQPLAMVLMLVLPATADAAVPTSALQAWDRYVASVESTLDFALPSTAATPRLDIDAEGQSIDVAEGTISDWRGSVFIPRVTLDRLLQRLQYPGTPPPQSDVLESRVLWRDANSLRVAIRLARRAIVTVSYDTEHEMRFRRASPFAASARSVATRIEEIGGRDHGFLWRLHSYWRYAEVNGGVQVDLRSLTLSRRIPALLRPAAAPLIERVGRESTVRTLDALRRYVTI
jgi:hypothetical protein